VKYKDGYNYQLVETIRFDDTNITPPETIKTKYITLDKTGTLWIKAGYCWDGSSGARDEGIIFSSTMVASLAHDALYQLMRMELLSPEWKTDSDILLITLLERSGVWPFRRWYFMRAVTWFGDSAIDPENAKKIFEVK
jgi:hypothetical protein|tara:strand:- start:2608 stop:3021 length:414 start_codon:yes stop_codon:yes gene_type:complete